MGTRVTRRTAPDTDAGADRFEDLFARERDGMVRVAYLICGSNAVAEEVAHDAFVRVYQRWGRIERPGAYLRRCVVNGALDARTRRRRGDTLLRSIAVSDEGPPEHDDVLDAVLRLPARARALVVLRYYQQLSTEQIAEVLEIPSGTVKSGLHRALAELREVLA